MENTYRLREEADSEARCQLACGHISALRTSSHEKIRHRIVPFITRHTAINIPAVIEPKIAIVTTICSIAEGIYEALKFYRNWMPKHALESYFDDILKFYDLNPARAQQCCQEADLFLVTYSDRTEIRDVNNAVLKIKYKVTA